MEACTVSKYHNEYNFMIQKLLL